MKNFLAICAALAAFPFLAPAIENTFTPAGESAEAQHSLVSGFVSLSQGVLTVTISTQGEPSQWNHVFLGTKGNPDSGYVHTSGQRGGQGMDFLVEGGTLYRWNGLGDRQEWKWQRIDTTTVTTKSNANSFTVSFPVEDLNLKAGGKLQIFVATNSENYQTCLDTLPRNDAVWQIEISEADLKAAPKSALSAPAADARERFKKIKSYACYYGKDKVEQLAERDAVIIETRYQTPENIAAIKKKSIVIGYISAGEDDKLRKGDGLGPGGYDSCYFDKNHDGQPDKNGTWNSYYANPNTQSWTDYFLAQARQMQERYGVDGFFLDTVETMVTYPECRDGMIALIRKLREAHPQAVIILNRGFDVIADTGDIVDGLMYESFTLSYDFASKSYLMMRPSALDFTRQLMQNVLKPQQEAHGLVVLALDYAASADDPNIRVAYDRAATLGAIPCVTSIYLDAIYDVAYQGKADPKWNSDFETAANRAYALPAARNGFPAGTTVIPSSNYSDYTVAPVVDGLSDKSKVGWRDRAWASMEARQAHSLEFHFPEPVTLHRLFIDWNIEGGTAYISRKLSVETKPAPQESWMGWVKTTLLGEKPRKAGWHSVWNTDHNLASTTVVDLDAAPITALRIVQPPGAGSAERPTVMWVQQVRAE